MGAATERRIRPLPLKRHAAFETPLRGRLQCLYGTGDSVAALCRAPFSQFASASPANRTEQLPAFVARLDNPDAALGQELLGLLAGELHRLPAFDAVRVPGTYLDWALVTVLQKVSERIMNNLRVCNWLRSSSPTAPANCPVRIATGLRISRGS